MRKFFLGLLMTVLLNPWMMAQSGGESRPIKPEGYLKKAVINVSGKARNYYSLSIAESSVINVQGPGVLKVFTRAGFKPGEADVLKYTLIYTLDGGQAKSIVVSGIERSKKATYPDGALGVPGEPHSFEIELLRGNHTLEFKLKENTVNVDARYIFTPGKAKKQEWMAFSPSIPSMPVDLVSRETTTSYYRFSTEKPLRINIIGPTELRVLTRTENHYQMKGRIHYRVQVKENSAVINTYQLSSKISEIAAYKDKNELIPGTACEFVINVPKGNHTYEILPLDKDKSTLLGRLLIPKTDVKPGN